MGIIPITRSGLATWERTYTDPLEDAEETRSCSLSLKDVENFMKYIKDKNEENPPANIDEIGIYLTRSNECGDVHPIPSKGNIPQISFVIVPIAGPEIYIDNAGFIMCVYAGKPDKSSSQLCPSNCKK